MPGALQRAQLPAQAQTIGIGEAQADDKTIVGLLGEAQDRGLQRALHIESRGAARATTEMRCATRLLLQKKDTPGRRCREAGDLPARLAACSGRWWPCPASSRR